MSSPSLAVVIAAHDAADTLPAQLAALADQQIDIETEIIVVDNGSTDATATVAAATDDPRVRVIAATDGSGAGYARNRGVAATGAGWIAFCDADDVVAPGWLAAVADALGRHEFVTGPLDTAALNEDWLAGSRGAAIATGQPMFEGVFPIASSCNLAIRRQLFDEHGGFDEAFRIGQDSELSLRLWRADVELHFAEAMVVRYRYRPTMRGVFDQARSFGRAQVAIERRLAELGVAAPSSGRAVRRGLWLLRSLTGLRSRAGRARWLYVCGTQVGRFVGRVRRR
ncbi:MAG: glycosyltransferase family A protein [Acidimicrobiales bacterium]|nr:glycosyltransferase family A protein [Acidimicrobiales bacterium]